MALLPVSRLFFLFLLSIFGLDLSGRGGPGCLVLLLTAKHPAEAEDRLSLRARVLGAGPVEKPRGQTSGFRAGGLWLGKGVSPDSVSPESAPVGLLGGVLVGEWGGGARLAPKGSLFYGDLYPREVGGWITGLSGESDLQAYSSQNPQRPPFTSSGRELDHEKETQKNPHVCYCGR